MQDPFKSFRQGNWVRDNLGTQSPLGGSISAKELMQLPNEMQKLTLAAGTLIRGNLSKDLWPDLSMLNAIAPRHRLTQIFIASITAGSMAEDGAASKKFLMGITNMLATQWLTKDDGRKRYGSPKKRKDGEAVQIEREDE